VPADLKVVAGYDGAAAQVLKTDAAGELQVDVLSSALPTGAATEATLSTLATEATVSTLATEATVSTLATEATVSTLATEATVSTLATEATVSTLATEATVSTLATEATVSTLATEATVSTLATEATVSTLATEATVLTLGTETTLSAIKTSVELLDNAVSGNELQVDVVTSALPIGAATSAAQTDGTQKTQLVDAAGDVVDVKLLSAALAGTDKGLITSTTIHGLTTGGGGGYVDVKVTPSGALNVEADITSSVLPTGAATETTLAAIKTAVELIDNAVSGNELQVDVVTSALPAGAATESTLASIEGDTSSLAGCVSGSEVQVDIVSSALPSGAATESTLADIKTSVQLIDNAVSGNELQVDIIAPLPSGTNNIGDVDVVSIVPSTGRSVVARARHVYSVTPVTTAAYQQLVLSLAATVNEVEIFDSSGETLVLATGGAGSEVDQAFVFPGGNGRIPLTIASGTRVSVKAVSATANAGEIAINFYS
jgi:hypothetical protein